MNTESDKHYTAYMAVYYEGQEAFSDGEDLASCPYTGLLYDRWVSGYYSKA